MAHTNTDETKKIPIGSAIVYIVEDTGSEMPIKTDFEKDENLLGYIKSGASLDDKITTYTAKDDLGKVSKTIMTDEEVTAKMGLITWNGKTLEKVTPATTSTETSGVRTTKGGGIANYSGKKYWLRFVNEDAIDGDNRITVLGYPSQGFSLTLDPSKENMLNPEFVCCPIDDDGHYWQLEEEILTSSEP